jgi:YbgC/YbaW family acyl-CoA thioester hydrolase
LEIPLFKTRLRVRTYECDSYGHVNNATFLNYCEVARVELLEKMGYDLVGLKKVGFLLVIVKIEIEYTKPAYANDELEVTVDWIERGKTSATFGQEIYNLNKNELIARAKIIWVATDLKGKPITIPDILLDSYRKTFGGLPSIKTK